jgi:hypothetical protein
MIRMMHSEAPGKLRQITVRQLVADRRKKQRRRSKPG